jgi:tetratricopeptide (TPR) repeat protein
MPEFQPSGVKEDFRKWQGLDGAVRGAKTEAEQAAASAALAAFLGEFPARWEGKEIPAPEAFMYAHLLQKCRLYPQAVVEVRRWIEVAPEDSVNYANAHLALIACLALSGDFPGAEAVLKEAWEGALKGREMDCRGAEEAIANAAMAAGNLELAANHYETLAVAGPGDVEDAILGVDCRLRLGKADEAVRLADRAAAAIKEGRAAERAKVLQQQVALVGKPSPGFSAARWWKGVGGPVTAESMKGKVTVVFSWNMKAAWAKWFFERLNRMVKDYAGRPVLFVGVSRLARFDPVNMCTDAELTDEKELVFYDMWTQQYEVACPLAVGAFQDTALVDAWAAHIVPAYVVVGKDGVVSYVRSGKNEEHFAALRGMVDRALER